MLTLLAGTGSKTYQLLASPRLSEDEARTLKRAGRLLRAEEREAASALLERYPFKFVGAMNDFGDKFDVLHANVSLADYVQLKRHVETGELKASLRQIQDALGEVGNWPRFIVCAFHDRDGHEDATESQPAVRRPSRPRVATSREPTGPDDADREVFRRDF